MDSISSNVGIEVGIYAMKKAIEIQDQGVMKLLESVSLPSSTQTDSGSGLTGLGQTLDVKG